MSRSAPTYIPSKPITVRVGQLVEVQASFCVVPITKGRYLMLSKLRSVCILNNQVQEVSLSVLDWNITDDFYVGSKRRNILVNKKSAHVTNEEDKAKRRVWDGWQWGNVGEREM